MRNLTDIISFPAVRQYIFVQQRAPLIFSICIPVFPLLPGCVHIPNPVCVGRWYINSQCTPTLLHLHSEQQRCVGHLLHLLLDELRLGSLLEVLRLGYFVHESHDLARSVASHIAGGADDENAGGREVSQAHYLFITASP